MLRKSCTFLLVIIMAFSGVVLTRAQSKSIVNKKINKGDKELLQGTNKKSVKNVNTFSVHSSQNLVLKPKGTGTIDTLSVRKWIGGDWKNEGTTTVGFGSSGQDVIVQWYKAPADLYVRAVGIGTATNENDQPATVKLVKLINYTTDDLNSYTDASILGYFPSEGDGYNNIAPFVNDATGAATGDWVSVNDNPLPFETPELWSDDGFGYPFTPVAKPYEDNAYDWVLMSELPIEPTVLRDEIFGIVVSNTGNSPAPSPPGDRQAFWAASSPTYPLLKFYEYETTAGEGNFGWKVRTIAIDFVAVVEIFGDEPPQFVDVDNLPTTLSTEAREVTANITDRNPGGGAAGVQTATLKYSVDGGTSWSDVAMTLASGDATDGTWSASIPGQVPGTTIDYYIEATDVNSTTSESAKFQYRIYQPTEGISTLLVFNGYDPADIGDYPMAYYFGMDDFTNYETYPFDHDIWAYGPLTTDLVNSYTNILEISNSNGGPAEYNDDVIAAWIAASAEHNYMLAGQEWLGARHSYADLDFTTGDFEFDILGVTHSYNDVSYDGTSGQLLPSKLTPIQGTLLGDSLYLAFTAHGTDSLSYDPAVEISVANWLDGFDVTEGVEVDATVETRGIVGEPAVDNLNCVAHRTLSAGNKIAFMSLDPLSVDTQPWDNYYWFGFSTVAPQIQVLHWFGADVSGVRDLKNVPNQFSLSQNYPNPFNPSTKIKFSVPKAGVVTLDLYNVLGQKVATLLNQEMNSSTYEIDFDATGLASGMYVYTLTAGDFSSSKKMVLLK